jgi:sec-independent protein translocase protein TatB
MLNFGWAELLVIGLVALIVIGPEDLPDMFRQLGRFTAKLRSMSREFSRAMEQAAKETGVKDVTKDLKGMTSAKSLGLEAVKSSVDKFEKWDPIKNAAKPTTVAKPLVPPAMPPTMPMTSAPKAVVDDALEAAEDLADHDDPVAKARQAARAAVMAEQAAKLKAIDEGTYVAEPSILPPAKKPRAVKVAAVDAAAKPRKTAKKADV